MTLYLVIVFNLCGVYVYRYVVAIRAGATSATAIETRTDATRQNENWNENRTESGLPNESATASTEAAKSAADVDGKSADPRMRRSGGLALPLRRSSLRENETMSEHVHTAAATDDVVTERVTRSADTQTASGADDLFHSTAPLDTLSGRSTEVTSPPWLHRHANRGSGSTEDDNSNPPDKSPTTATSAAPVSHSGSSRKPPGHPTTEMQRDSRGSSTIEAGGAASTTSAGSARSRHASSPAGGLLAPLDDDAQSPVRSQADSRGAEQRRRGEEQHRNSDDDEFGRHDDVSVTVLGSTVALMVRCSVRLSSVCL